MQRAAIPILLCFVGSLTASPAAGADRVDLQMRLTSSVPSSTTGLDFHVTFRHPDDPDQKPPPLTSVVLHAPEGTRFHPDALPQCRASDAELQTLGNRACPSESRLTVGSLTATTGFPAPLDVVKGDNTVYNGPGQIIELITFEETEVAAGFDRLRIEGSTLIANPPASPGGPPDGRTTVRSIDFTIPAIAGPGGPYITTPQRCPASGEWTSVGEFRFADGGSATASSATPCRAATSQGVAGERRTARQRPVLVAYRHGASARWVHQRRSLGVALRVDGRLSGVRVRLLRLRPRRTVATVHAGTLARDTQVRLAVRRRLQPGRYRLAVTGRTDDNQPVRSTRTFRIRP